MAVDLEALRMRLLVVACISCLAALALNGVAEAQTTGSPEPVALDAASAPPHRIAPRLASHPAVVGIHDPTCEPVYPEISTKLHRDTVTRLRLMISSEGRITDAVVLVPSGTQPYHVAIDDAVLAAIVKCPVQRHASGYDGQPLESTLDVDYKLHWEH